MRHILLTGIFGCCCFGIFAKTIFVKSSSVDGGNGLSWATAYVDLSIALSDAEPGDQVWVANGTYYPTTGNDRSVYFKVTAGVKLYGGFKGDESSPHQRNIQTNKSVLSGDIGERGKENDNSFTVIAFVNADEYNLLDGFIITGGYADGNGPSGDPERCGGGLHINANSGNNLASPIIQNCAIQNNFGRDGGGAYVSGRKNTCLPTFKNCQFLNNRAQLDGGAVYNDGRNGGKVVPSFDQCTFDGNSANYGGAICNYGGGGECSPNISNCTFSNNEANLRGGAIYNMDIDGTVHPAVKNCQFSGNKAVAGNGMYTFNRYEDKIEGKVNSSENDN